MELQGTKKLQSAIEEENIPGRTLSFDRYDVLVMFPPAMARQPSWAEPTGPPTIPSGRALLAQLQPDEFLVMGFDSTIDFRPPLTTPPAAQLAKGTPPIFGGGMDPRPPEAFLHKEARFVQVEEGLYRDGVWTPAKSQPAASPARGLTLPKEGAMFRIKLQWD
jgi:hypothetical protein